MAKTNSMLKIKTLKQLRDMDISEDCPKIKGLPDTIDPTKYYPYVEEILSQKWVNVRNILENNNLFNWRCEQYKKYRKNSHLFQKDYVVLYNQYVINSLPYEFWLFDFVMNGNMDGEKK